MDSAFACLFNHDLNVLLIDLKQDVNNALFAHSVSKQPHISISLLITRHQTTPFNPYNTANMTTNASNTPAPSMFNQVTINPADAFPRFAEFPNEIQVIIWGMAASPTEPLKLNQLFFRAMARYPLRIASLRGPFFRLTSRNWLPFYAHYVEFLGCRGTAVARRNLLGMCRNSRFAVLKAWKDEVKDIVVIKPGPEIRIKEKIILLLARLIQECLSN